MPTSQSAFFPNDANGRKSESPPTGGHKCDPHDPLLSFPVTLCSSIFLSTNPKMRPGVLRVKRRGKNMG